MIDADINILAGTCCCTCIQKPLCDRPRSKIAGPWSIYVVSLPRYSQPAFQTFTQCTHLLAVIENSPHPHKTLVKDLKFDDLKSV